MVKEIKSVGEQSRVFIYYKDPERIYNDGKFNWESVGGYYGIGRNEKYLMEIMYKYSKSPQAFKKLMNQINNFDFRKEEEFTIKYNTADD